MRPGICYRKRESVCIAFPNRNSQFYFILFYWTRCTSAPMQNFRVRPQKTPVLWASIYQIGWVFYYFFFIKITKKSLKIRNFSAGFTRIFSNHFFYQKEKLILQFSVCVKKQQLGNQKIWVGQDRKTVWFFFLPQGYFFFNIIHIFSNYNTHISWMHNLH